MLAAAGPLPAHNGDWAYEFKWDGMRVLVWIDEDRPRAVTRNGRDITDAFPELAGLGASIQSDQVILDGELVVLGEGGRPSFSRLQRRMHASSANEARRASALDPASVLIFDLLYLKGQPLLEATYDERRGGLEQLGLIGSSWSVIPSFTAESGPVVLRSALEFGMEGIVAKRRASTYRPGFRSHDWIKVKDTHTQEVVIGGWTDGQGDRRGTFGALILGLPVEGTRATLRFIGNVGSGFPLAGRVELAKILKAAGRSTSPFDDQLPRAIARDAHWVRPTRVGEVRFSEWTPAGRLRHPVWRGLRPDKSAEGVRREP